MSKLARIEISKGIKAARFSFFPSINSSEFLQFPSDHSVFSSSSHSSPSVLVRQLVSNILAFPVNLLPIFRSIYKHSDIELNLQHAFTFTTLPYLHLQFIFTLCR